VKQANRALGVGLVVFLAGIGRDLQWHATHNTQREFETASKQVEVHWLLWLGVVVIILAASAALMRSEPAPRTFSYRLTFASALAYAGVSVWHFIEHANGNDPQLAHVFLYAGAFGIVLGAVLALVGRRGRGVPPSSLAHDGVRGGPNRR
jgi:cytochrome bd-type quinol oxidase subunit 2